MARTCEGHCALNLARGVVVIVRVINKVRLPADVAGPRDGWPAGVSLECANRRVGPPQSLIGRSSFQPVFEVTEVEGYLDGASATSLQQCDLFVHPCTKCRVRALVESRIAQRR